MAKKPIGIKDFNVEMVPIDQLIHYINNPKAHPAGQVDKIASSIKNFGFLVPLVIDAQGEVIAGHGRLLAARRLNIGLVPCVRAEHLTPAQVKALRIADNRVAESAWFPETLALELQTLQELEMPLEMTGFDQEELDRLLNFTPKDPAEPKGDGGPAGFVIQYSIIFEGEDQQNLWYDFLSWLKAKYPQEETVASRLVQHIVPLGVKNHEQG